MRILFTAIFILLFQSLFSKGIIIGKDKLIEDIFQTYEIHEIDSFTIDISKDYDKVILHLGRRYPFDPGSFFGTEKSQENFSRFSYLLDSLNIRLYFWFMDSFGDEMFQEMHKDHLEIIWDLKHHLNRLEVPYEGLVLDMEWINRPNGNNNESYFEILTNVKSNFPDKELYAFVSIIEVPEHNIERGFDEKHLLTITNNLIPMLYPVDGGFYVKYNMLKLWLHKKRLLQLREYYDSNNYQVAVSVEQGMIIKSNKEARIINHLQETDTTFNNFKKVWNINRKLYSIIKYKALNDCYVNNNRGENIHVKRRDKIYYLKISEEFIKKDDYIWEYDHVKRFGF